MSTRSGKRIHSSFHENTAVVEPEPTAKSERKTRGKRAKENLEDLSVALFKNKKRNNYVTYPTDDELNGDVAKKDDEIKPSRVLRKNALKEHNIVENSEVQETTTNDAKSLIRKSRRWKKNEDAHDTEEAENHENVATEVIEQPKPKKNKKKKKGTIQITNTSQDEVPAKKASPEKEVTTKKSKKKKKKVKQSTEVVEDIQQNNSKMSMDSFHSAAGSPDGKIDSGPSENGPEKLNTTFEKEEPENNSKRLSKADVLPETVTDTVPMDVEDTKPNGIIEKRSKKRKSMTKDSTFDKSQASMITDDTEKEVNSTKELKDRHSSIKDTTFQTNKVEKDNTINISSTSLRGRTSNIKNSTFNNSNTSVLNNIEKDTEPNLNTSKFKQRKSINTTFEKSKTSIADKLIETAESSNMSLKQLRRRKSLTTTIDKIVNTTFEKDSEMKDRTFEKSNTSILNGKDLQKSTENLNTLVTRSSRRKSYSGTTNNTTFDKDSEVKNSTFDKTTVSKVENDVLNTSNISNKSLRSRKSLNNNTFDKEKADTTYEKVKDSTVSKDINSESISKDKSTINVTYEKTNETFEKDSSSSFDAFKKGANNRKSSIRDVSFDKNSSIQSLSKEDFEKTENVLSSSTIKNSMKRQSMVFDTTTTKNLNSTFDKQTEPKRKSLRLSTADVLNTTFDKSAEKQESKSSLISSDNSVSDKSDVSRISITSDDTTENIVNTTPVLIESSMDESQIKEPEKEVSAPQTPLKREGTFTKESPVKVQSPLTPGRRSSGAPTAGCTPYHVGKSSQKKHMLNVTRSIEKRASVEAAPRMTRVMFCSPVDNPMIVVEKKKIIKSNLKGSNKSFVFDDSVSVPRAGRKRSYTQSDAEEARAKRSRLTEDLQHSVDRLSRPRTTSAAAKFTNTTPKKGTPGPKSEVKLSRTKLPNFAALHQKQFDKMESLDECQERKAKRAKQLLTPTGSTNIVDRISPKNNTEPQKPVATKDPKKPKEKTDTPTKRLPTLESLRPGFTRFGFKLNYDINPFSVPAKDRKPKETVPKEKVNGGLLRQGTLPSLTGATSIRKEVAKQTVMREKSFGEKRNVKRNENRTIIKGVRTNRRFELQMKLRNID
ncbi:uncharacterized protein LOC142981070 [Anticarsia gemmatalis]|uniref:uncharacterized protein LOC142981070 n=1 Tax=Anticarsia gemmatalis TaxID=129554 RepID=UPI003F760756